MQNDKPGINRLNYLSVGYELIEEPLNLKEQGRQWFNMIYRQNASDSPGNGLMLGAVYWMMECMHVQHQVLYVADACPQALDRLRVSSKSKGNDYSNVQPLLADWMDLPEHLCDFSLVTGDNAFIYLKYPEQWRKFLKEINRRMQSFGILLFRTFSVPGFHKKCSLERIARKYAGLNSPNYTELRTRMLFNCWEPDSFRINTAEVYKTYEQNREHLKKILRLSGSCSSPNDLETISKYRDADIIYYAPPLDKLIELVGEYFDICSVHFGPYSLAQYFPLIVARKS